MTGRGRGPLAAALLLACCAPAPPCPSDLALIERFRAQPALFEQLAREPGNAELRQRLGVAETRVLEDGLVLLLAWQLDFAGPGGAVKGYARSPRPPEGLVESIDAAASPGEAGTRQLYRRIEGQWYVYYASSD